MKTTSKLITACAATALSLLPADAWAGPEGRVLSLLHGATVSQADPARDVEALLRRARQLMDDGSLDAASALIDQAEQIEPRGGLFQFGDSPKKARQELARRREAMGPQDPFRRAAPVAPQDPTAAAPMRLPSVTGAASPAPISAAPATQATGEQRGQSDALVLAARQALARGDMRSAVGAVEQAKRLQVNYGFLDDSPAKVEATMRKLADLAEGRVGPSSSEAYRRQYGEAMMEQAHALLRWKQFDDAQRLANDAKSLGIDYPAFAKGPDVLLEQIEAERRLAGGAQPSGVVPAGFAAEPARLGNGYDVMPAGGASPRDVNSQQFPANAYPGAQAVYDGSVDGTRNMAATSTQPAGNELQFSFPDGDQPVEAGAENAAGVVPGQAPAMATPLSDAASDGQRLFDQGLQALREGRPEIAVELFRQAYQFEAQLDPLTRHRLQEHLQLLSAPAPRQPQDGSMIDAVATQQQLLAKQVSVEVNRQQAAARAVMKKEPQKALDILTTTRAMVDGNADLSPDARNQLTRYIDLSVREVQDHIKKNQGQLDLDARNAAVQGDVDRDRQMKAEIQDKLAVLVDDYNKLMDEQRFAEAEVLAKQAAALDPDNALVIQLQVQSRNIRRLSENMDIRDAHERGMTDALIDVDRSGTPFVGPIEFPSINDWNDLTKRRSQLKAEGRTRRTPRDAEIEKRLSTPVLLRYQQRPLSEVMHDLARLASVNLYLDPQGLAEEGVTSDSPVTINLSQEISLKSALTLILEPLRLSYVIKDEVLKITSEQHRRGDLYQMTYHVADLVIPIPNFVPGGNLGLNGALNEAHNRLGYSGAGGGFTQQTPLAIVASDNGGTSSAAINPALLAQMNAAGAGIGGPPATGVPQQMGFGPPGLGGGAQADFESLIELITTTIQPSSWEEVGGTGTVAPFETNLSLVVSQTQEVHEEIVDLLQQLRRLQDLQVTIEVRFITLSDNFFERIGVDFDFDIDNENASAINTGSIDTIDRGNQPSVTLGLNPAGATADLQFRQESFETALPPFAFDPGSVSTFGFAILSDIEAFFLIAAAQGDNRTNILQAPKVTLFNGQQAFVSDTSQRPFVTSVVPVVGDFAAAQQPVIVVLSEGTSLTVQAVVSSDRRFVRLTVVPFFSQIGEVEEFTFTGSKTTKKSSSSTTDDDDDTTNDSDTEEETVEGTTVQLPTFSFVTVTTTVSVPDGGTVLLGGIKRLNEGRVERGLPILSKLPYINRLFRNVGVGRTTSSLMMMVTPRIIIQEEEEEKLGLVP